MRHAGEKEVAELMSSVIRINSKIASRGTCGEKEGVSVIRYM